MLGYYFFLALRSLRRTRMLTALMVLAIAVGIGASMTTLSVMFLLSGDPLPAKSGKLFFPQADPLTGTGRVCGVSVSSAPRNTPAISENGTGTPR